MKQLFSLFMIFLLANPATAQQKHSRYERAARPARDGAARPTKYVSVNYPNEISLLLPMIGSLNSLQTTSPGIMFRRHITADGKWAVQLAAHAFLGETLEQYDTEKIKTTHGFYAMPGVSYFFRGNDRKFAPYVSGSLMAGKTDYDLEDNRYPAQPRTFSLRNQPLLGGAATIGANFYGSHRKHTLVGLLLTVGCLTKPLPDQSPVFVKIGVALGGRF